MAKEIIKRQKKESWEIRQSFKFWYENKFFNKWMKKFTMPEKMTYQEFYYIMKKFWSDGTIACTQKINIPEEVVDMVNPWVFTPWVMANKYNCYDFPTHARAINTRGVNYISVEAKELDKDIVIGWCQANHKSVYSMLAPKINQIVDVEMVIRICTKNQQAPWIVVASPEDKKAVDSLIESLEGDEPVLITMLEDLKNVKSLNSSAPYVVDKLEQLRQKLEDDCDTVIGESNVGIAQKKEHFTDDEVQANNSQIQENADNYVDEINAFFERIKNASGLGWEFKIELAHEIEMEYNDNEDDKPEEEPNDE